MTVTPHVRLTVNDLQQQYRMGMLTVKGYLYNWLLASRKRGWKLRTTVREFCRELGVSKSAFYKAIAELRAEPQSDFRFEVRGEIVLWIDDGSTAEDTASTVGDTVSTIVDTASTVMESETPEASHSKASSGSSDLSQTLSQIEEESLDANKQPTGNGSVRDPEARPPINVVQILVETKRRLMEQIAKQRQERELRLQRRGIVFRPAGGANTTDNFVLSGCCSPLGLPAGAHYQPT